MITWCSLTITTDHADTLRGEMFHEPSVAPGFSGGTGYLQLLDAWGKRPDAILSLATVERVISR
ncbi:hypothetical protein ASE27_19490 [Oerskovia sp. Root918]|nr:hypothetical protein ASE27_19490 [Oerskovia sp. Root918]